MGKYICILFIKTNQSHKRFDGTNLYISPCISLLGEFSTGVFVTGVSTSWPKRLSTFRNLIVLLLLWEREDPEEKEDNEEEAIWRR